MRLVDSSEYKKILLNILVEVDSICRKHNIKYMLAYGTLLGAVRHKGFIPWDDDIDIILLPKEYEKLRTIIAKGDYNINFLDPYTNKKTIFPFGKVCAKNTIIKEATCIDVPEYGAFIDVFPATYITDSKMKQKYIQKWHRFLNRVIQHSAMESYEKCDSLSRNILRVISFYFTRLINPHKLAKKYLDDYLRYNTIKSNSRSILAGAIFPTEYFDDIIDLEFEGYQLMAPAHYDAILQQNYGDYMSLPPEEKRVPTHKLNCYINDPA